MSDEAKPTFSLLERLGRMADALLAPVAPARALARAEARVRLHQARTVHAALSTLDAARKDRTTRDWRAPTKSADDVIVADLATVNARARQMVRDTWGGQSAVRGYVRHVIGSGISFRSTAADPYTDPRQDDPETAVEYKAFARGINRLWRRWIRRAEWVDVEGKKTFLGVQAQLTKEFITAGEAFLVLGYERRPQAVGLMLQTFEPEQLALDLLRSPKTGNEIRGGIEIDATGRAVAYWIHTGGHPMERLQRGQPERIPAYRVFHLMEQDRPRQTHGLTRFSPVMIKQRHTQMYDDYEIIGKRQEACIGAWTRGTGDAGFMPNLATGAKAADRRELVWEPGMLLDLGPNPQAELHLLNPQRPGAQYQPFMQQQLMEIAAGLGMDYALLVRDYTKATYSGQRQGLLEFWAETDPIQENLVDLVLLRVWEEFVRVAVIERRVVPPAAYWYDLEVQAACLEADWQPAPKYWIDPARQAAAVKILLDARLTTRAIELNRLGYSWQEIFDQIAEEEGYAEDRGIELPESGGDPAIDPMEPRPGSEAGGDNQGRVPAQQRRGRRGNGRLSARLTESILASALGEP